MLFHRMKYFPWANWSMWMFLLLIVFSYWNTQLLLTWILVEFDKSFDGFIMSSIHDVFFGCSHLIFRGNELLSENSNEQIWWEFFALWIKSSFSLYLMSLDTQTIDFTLLSDSYVVSTHVVVLSFFDKFVCYNWFVYLSFEMHEIKWFFECF